MQVEAAEKAAKKVAPVTTAEPEENFDWDAYENDAVVPASEKDALTQKYAETLSKVGEKEVVEGTVISMNKREVVVNIGYKSDGIISLNEFRYDPELKVGDKVIVDDLNYERPSVWSGFSKSNHVTIQINRLFAESPLYTIVSFYDLQKKHHNGKGIGGGYVKLLAPNKIRWVLDENAGSFETEYPIIGFSVPTDIIMTKEE